MEKWSTYKNQRGTNRTLVSSLNMLTNIQNMQKVQKEIDRLEAEAEAKDIQSSSPPSSIRRTHDSAKKPAIANQAVNGTTSAEAELAQENDAASDVAKDVEQVRIEDNVEEEV